VSGGTPSSGGGTSSGSSSGTSSDTSGGWDDGGGSDSGSSDSGPMVWITSTGTKYHSIPDCGTTKTSWQIPLDEAIAQGYGKCKNCW
jgi:hypothetical protein